MGVVTRKQLEGNAAWAKALAASDAAKPKRKRPGDGPAMNGLERAYAARLQLLVTAGDVIGFGFNDVRLRYGTGAFFKGDFLIRFADGRLEVHETKGYERPAAIARLKACALRYPWIAFVLVKRVNREWDFETIGAN